MAYVGAVKLLSKFTPASWGEAILAGGLTTLKLFLIGSIIKLMAVFGIGILVFTGMEELVGAITNRLTQFAEGTNITGFPQAVEMLHMIGIPYAINVITTAYISATTTKLTISGWRLYWKGV